MPTLPEQSLLEALDKMLSGEVPLDEQSYRLVVLAELKNIRQQNMVVLHKIDGNGSPGLMQRMLLMEAAVPQDLMDMVRWWRAAERRNQWLGQPLTIAIILGALGILWGLLTGHVHITP